MVKILLTILLITFTSKTFVDTATAAYKDSLTKLSIQDEEGKSEKEENKNSKKPYEELYWNNLADDDSASGNLLSSFILRHHATYNQFVSNLNTPPPDFI